MKQEEAKYYVVHREDEGYGTIVYEDREELIEALEDPETLWDDTEFVEHQFLAPGQACIIKGSIVVPKVVRRLVEVEIE